MPKDECSIVQVLTEIVNTYGTDILKDRKRVCALLSDMASGDHRAKERRRFRMALQSGAVDILLKAPTDQAGRELCINESVAHLISQTDMAENIARMTVMSVAEALSLTVLPPSEKAVTSKAPKTANNIPISSTVNDSSAAQSNDKPENSRKKTNAVLTCAGILFTVIVLATVLYGIFVAASPVRNWLIGIGSGLLLTEIIIVISYVFQEYVLFNEMCQTVSIAIPIVFVMNILLRILLGNEEYELIFRILSAFAAVGSMANAITTRVVWEENLTLPNIVMAVCSAFLFFIWPGDFSWTVWQWIIGIGGGLLLTVIVFFAVSILDAIGPEMFISLSVILLLLTILNTVLLFEVGANYLIIGKCYMVMLSLGTVIGTVMCYSEADTGFQTLNIILLVINIGVFLLLTFGSLEYFTSTVQVILDKIQISS